MLLSMLNVLLIDIARYGDASHDLFVPGDSSDSMLTIISLLVIYNSYDSHWS